MADPIKILRSLHEIASSYTVFESDQVLTEHQLNSLADYLNDQERLTRVELLGIGIVGGLEVSTVDGTVRVGKGVGVTTDGDLLVLAADATFDRCKPYNESAPVYAPFYVGTVMRKVFELVREGKADPLGQPMTTLPGPLADMVVLMLMESYEKDRDLCSGSDCDNLGRDAVHTPRVLLVSRTDASALLSVLSTVSTAALLLPNLVADRPQITGKIATTGALAKLYRDSCHNIHTSLAGNLGKLFAKLPGLLGDLFGGDPAPSWVARLNAIQAEFAGRNVGIQYYYSFLKDVVDNWNELLEALLDDDSVLCPDLAAFPKHLVLGDLTDPTQSRTGLYPSPLVGSSRKQSDRARFLLRKLHVLITTFNLPSSNTLPVVVTPSRSEAVSLEERAIPYYYEVGDSLPPIHRHWNYRLSRRGAEASNLGYRAKDFGGTAVAQNPLASQIGRYDFFRVEGHLGKNVSQAKQALEDVIRTRNLPFLVRAVLLHSDRSRIVIKPPIRYGDLHRFHYLLRTEVATHLDDSVNFNEHFKTRIDKALADREFPDLQISNTANARHGEVRNAIKSVQPAMASKRYADYRSDANWKGAYPGVVNAAGNFKSALGDIVRTDLTTPFDSITISNHPAWLDWLDTLIQTKDDHEDDKLLFPNFLAAHPGFEHFGGVARGGTFVLVYDDSGQVVADGTLPYHWPEIAEDQPDEPDLKPPVFRPPVLIDTSIKLIPPLDLKFDKKLLDFETKLKGTVFKDQIETQNKQLDFLKQSVQIFGGKAIVGSGVIDPRRDVADPLLKSHLGELDSKRLLVEELRGVIIDPVTPDGIREKSQKELVRVEQELADTIKRSSTFLIDAGIGMQAGSDGGKAIAVISQGLEKVAGTKALDTLKSFGATVQSPQIKQVFIQRGL